MSIERDPTSDIASQNLVQIDVDSMDDGQRLDRWLAQRLQGASRSEIQRWIKEGRVLVDEHPAKSSQPIEHGQTVQVLMPAAKINSNALLPENIPLDIVYECENFLALNKPAGIIVHPAPGNPSGTLVNALLHHYPEIRGVGTPERPGVVHRLDQGTSGLILFARNEQTLRALQHQFKERVIYKEYLALLEGSITPERATISAPIGRHPTNRKRQAVLTSSSTHPSARVALTDYEVLGRYHGETQNDIGSGNFSYVRAMPKTGRTHQIRVHFSWLRHPVVGDTVYGYRRQRLQLNRLFLHAHRLRLCLPEMEKTLELEVPLPDELSILLESLALQEP